MPPYLRDVLKNEEAKPVPKGDVAALLLRASALATAKKSPNSTQQQTAPAPTLCDAAVLSTNNLFILLGGSAIELTPQVRW